MKTKRKPEQVLEKMMRFLKWVFLEDELRGIAWFIIAVVVFAVMVALAWQPPHERYQAVFDDCIVADTLTAEQCHDIALAVIQ